ncbi:Arf GTPase activating protein [Quillaja saponaria]|uniref:Arf GTPase activating protein n=1 Tax=Quillaja saponaria TaxID=32244 RepID=A0AAD7PZH6_QUISA|nr:Arf GTPase activating protein [Quillaja saponaria]
MGSRKEEERNEKIIRGLMKLPPNRRCINCNSLGPQYVCTNFWTFICITCSGIHREFTHRVKSVSMAKFTLQEVEALQNGGNQHAREIYLKDWDFQRQRFLDTSNVDKIREFIRNVYVDRRYAGGKTSSKPPRDVQSSKIHEDETRRASSYHSYSQSPPYDYQYEDRRYGKPGAVLTRKPGSDRGLYEGKMSNLIYGPGRLSDHASEERFANEGSSGVSDYSVSSGGDPFKYDLKYSNGPSRASSSEDVWSQRRKTSFSETSATRDADRIPRPQRTASSGSFGSVDRNSLYLKSFNSSLDFFTEPEQASGLLQDKLSTFPQPSGPTRSISWDLSRPPVPQEPISSASSFDLFQLQALPQILLNSSHLYIWIKHHQSYLSLKIMVGQHLIHLCQATSAAYIEKPAGILSSKELLSEKLDPFASLNSSMQWPSFETSNVDGSSSIITSPWQNLHDEQASVLSTNTQAWNAFGDSSGLLPVEAINQGLQVHNLSSTGDQCLDLRASEDMNKVWVQNPDSTGGVPDHNVPLDVVAGSSFPPYVFSLMEETQLGGLNHKSSNPFDLPYDSALEQNNSFVDMSSLQAALPKTQMPSTFDDAVAQPWFSQKPVAPYIQAAGQGMSSHEDLLLLLAGNPFA